MANNALIGAVRAEATLESGKFVSGAKKIRQEAKATETQLKKSFGAMGAAVKGFGGALTAGLSIGLLAGVAKKVLDYAGSLGEVAQQLGVTTKELQTFRFAAQQNGATVEQADQALGKFAISISKAQSGSKQAAEAFKAVGVSLNDLKTKSRTEILGQIADQMKATGGASANAAAGVAIFGKGFLKIAPTLDQGSAGLNALSAAAEKLGIVLSDQQIQNADETADKLDAVKTVLAAQIAGTVADNAASIVTLAQALAQLTGSIVNFLGSNPQAALGILGALAGSRFGIPGAAAGGLAGMFAGGRMAAQRDANSTDVKFLRDRLQKEAAVLRSFADKNKNGAALNLGPQTAKVRQLTAQLEKAVAGRRASGGTVATGALPQFLAPSGGGGKKGRTPRGPRDRSDDVAFQFEQELQRAHADVLRAQQGMARTSEERARIALQLLDIERQMQEAELNDRVRRAERDFAEGKITAGTLEQVKAQAEALRFQYDEADALQRKAIADDLAADKARDAAVLTDSAYDLRLEQLQNEAALAETASERREVELRILELMKEQERARLEAVIADTQASELAKAQAQQRLDSLDSIYGGRAAGVVQGTRGPMEDWLAGLPTTAAKAQEAMEQLQVQGFEGLIDAAVALTEGFDNAKDALLSTLKSFLQGVLRMQLQQLAGGALGGGFNLGSMFGSIFGGATGGSSGVTLGTSPFPGAMSYSGNPLVPGFAAGGSFRVGGIPGIDRNALMLNGIPVARVSRGERINISNDNAPGRGRHGRSGDVNFNLYGLTDADGFRRNERQISRNAKRKLGLG